MLNAIDSSAKLNDKTHHIVFNCAAFEKETNEDIKKFLQFVKNNKAESKLTKEIENMLEVKRFQQSFLNEYMATKLFETDFFNRGKDEGLEEGIEIGFEKGEYNARLDTAKNLLEMGLPIETVMKGTGLSKSELEPLLK